jgi:hypothetical protein
LYFQFYNETKLMCTFFVFFFSVFILFEVPPPDFFAPPPLARNPGYATGTDLFYAKWKSTCNNYIILLF